MLDRRPGMALVALVLAWPGTASGVGDEQTDAVLQEGRRLYLLWCVQCHGRDASGTNKGPSLEGGGAASTHYYVSSGRMPLTDPDDPPRRSEPIFTEQQIDALVSFVGDLAGGPGVPRVDASAGDPALGASLFLVNCASCHGASGAGTALASGFQAPSLAPATPTQIAEAMIVGPGTMPRFVPPMTRRQMVAVVAYVQTLQDPPTPGGHPLGFVGPIAEGAVAVLLGMGALLLALRWIGARAEAPGGRPRERP